MGEQAYLWFKSAHVLGGIVFVGNLLVTALWKTLADRTGEPRVVAFAQRLVTRTDFCFTGAGAIVVFMSGMLMIVPYDVELWNVPWLLWGLGLFLLSALIWLLVLVPLQIRQAQLAAGFARGGEIPASYRRLSRAWVRVGSLATLPPLVNVFLMVLKPE